MRRLAAEFVRLGSVRSYRSGALAATAAAPLGSLLVGVTNHLDTTSTFASVAASGTTLGLVGFGAWAASTTASEYAAGSMHVSLATGGSRRQIVAARIGAVALVALICGVAATALESVLTWSVQPPGGITAGNLAGLLIIPVTYAGVATVGAAIGLIGRSSGWGIAVVATALLGPQAAGGLLGGLRESVVGAVPGVVVNQVVNLAHVPASQRFPAGTAAAVAAMLLVVTATVAVAALTVERRDGG